MVSPKIKAFRVSHKILTYSNLILFNNYTGNPLSQNKIQTTGPNKNTENKSNNRINGDDIETKFEYADVLMKEYLNENTVGQDSKEVISTVNLLKEIIQTKSLQVTRFERELKSREEKLSQTLNELSLEQLENFSDLVLNKRTHDVESFGKQNEPTYKLEKIHFEYYFDELQTYVSFLKKNPNQPFEEEKKKEPDMKRSQTNRNIIDNKISASDIKSPTNAKVNLNNSIVMLKNNDQGTKANPTDLKNSVRPNNNNAANTKLNSSMPANSKSPSALVKSQPAQNANANAKQNLNNSMVKKPTGLTTTSTESMQNLHNFKNSSSAMKNPAVIDTKIMASNKSLLASVENIKKLEEIETDHDNFMLKNNDDLLVDSGFDSDKDNRELYELKRRERLKNKQNASLNGIEPIPENENSFVGDNKKKLPRSLSNLGPSVRNLKNAPSDSNNSITYTPSIGNLNNTTTRNVNGKGVESKTSVDFYPNNNNDLNSSVKMVKILFN
jgi:hypothetical protein